MMKPIDRVRRWWTGDDTSPPSPRDPAAGASAVPTPPAAPPPVKRESPWLARLDEAGIPRTLVYPSTTLARLLDQTADRFSDATAVVYGDTRWTYRELLSQVNRTAGGLASLGVRRGDRVLLTLPNCPEFVTMFFAVQKLGATVVNAGPLMGADDLRAAMAMTTPRVAVGLDLQADTLRKAGKHSTVDAWVWVSLQGYQPVLRRLGYQWKLWHVHGPENGKAHAPAARNGNGHDNGHAHANGHSTNGRHVEEVSLPDLLARAPSRPPTVEPDPCRTAVLQPTGGTTGTLKLAELSHRSLLANATQVNAWLGCRPGQERILAVLPMFHVFGLTSCLITGVFCGGEMILATRFVIGDTMEMLRRHRPTIFPLVPAICDAISNRLEYEAKKGEARPPLSAEAGLRLCVSGAAPLPMPVAERFERLTGAKVMEGYGLTEASPVTHVNLPGKARAGSIGLPLPDTRVRVVDMDDDTRDVPPGESGEMLICGPQVMGGYFANPEATAAALVPDYDGDTWLHTGDVVRMDADGYFYVLDRKKDMVIRSGMKVYPNKVEKVLRTHARVADVAVVGRADAVHTETVVAVLTLRGGGGAEDRAKVEDELRGLCREHLAPYEVPQVFEFRAELPRSPLGKLLRRELRKPPAEAVHPGKNGKNGHGRNGHDPGARAGSDGNGTKVEG